MKSRYVVFDIGNVLLKATHRDFLQKHFGISETDRIVEEVFHQPEFALFEKGDLTNAQLQSIYHERFPNDIDKIEFTISHWGDLNSYMCESWDIVKKLKRNNVPVYLLSTMGKEWKEAIFKRFEDFKIVDGAVFSYQVHSNKPESRIYEELFTKYSLNPKEGIFVDDKKENIDQAIVLGMKGIVFKNAKEIEEYLNKELEGI